MMVQRILSPVGKSDIPEALARLLEQYGVRGGRFGQQIFWVYQNIALPLEGLCLNTRLAAEFRREMANTTAQDPSLGTLVTLTGELDIGLGFLVDGISYRGRLALWNGQSNLISPILKPGSPKDWAIDWYEAAAQMVREDLQLLNNEGNRILPARLVWPPERPASPLNAGPALIDGHLINCCPVIRGDNDLVMRVMWQIVPDNLVASLNYSGETAESTLVLMGGETGSTVLGTFKEWKFVPGEVPPAYTVDPALLLANNEDDFRNM